MKHLIFSLFFLTNFTFATTINVPTDYPTIQAGINASTDGDTVLVAAGTYVENINYNGKNIVVGSLYLTLQDTSYISSTIIDGNESGSVVTFANYNYTSPSLVGFTIQGGSGLEVSGPTYGGGIYINGASPILTSLKITNNSATRGGGIYARSSSMVLSQSIIEGNSAVDYGGGVHCHSQGSPKIQNCVIANNSHTGTSWNGAGLCFFGGPNADVINCTIVNNHNSSSSYGAGINAMSYNTIVDVVNCIIWNNTFGGSNSTSQQVKVYDYATINLQNTNYEGSITSGTGTINSSISVDPLFVDIINGDYNLSNFSPLIGAGILTDNVPSTDIVGNTRPNPAGSTPDIGAYENPYGVPQPKVWYVSNTGSDSNEGSANEPFATIQAGINAASSGDTVSVAAGTYAENVLLENPDDGPYKSINVIGEDKNTTIIDGGGNGRVVVLRDCDSNTLLKNFTIQNGYGSEDSNDTEADEGAGIFVRNGSPRIENCIIKNNVSEGWGGGICVIGDNPLLKGLTIYDNLASDGSGMAIVATDPSIINCTIVDNNGQGMWVTHNSNPTLINSIVRNNSSEQIYFREVDNPSTIDISYSNIQDGQDSIVTNNNGTVTWGTGNIDANPRFCGPDSADFSLGENSPSAGTGEDGSNMGSFNVECGDVSLVHSVPSEYSNIQSAIDESLDGDVVMVQNGTYLENINFEGKGITVTSVTGPDSTIIDGGGTDIVVTFDSNEDANSVLTGFTITNGNAQQPWPYNRGGGVNCQNSSPRMFDLIITGNTGQGGGGGVYIKNASPEMHYCDITDNVAGWNGGGMYIEGVNQGYSAYFHQVDIRGNTGSAGGGVQIQNSNPTFAFVEVSGNTGDVGGGIHFEQSNAQLYNVTIVNNTAQTGGGIQLKENYSDISSEVHLENSIVWGNDPQQIYFHEEGMPNYMSILHSNIEGGYDAIEFNSNGDLLESEGNIDADPLFCNFDNGNFSLAENSPCVNVDWDSEEYMGAHGIGCGLLDSELPAILSIEDVPEDQGNWVYIEFSSSIHDSDDEGPLGIYTIERQDGEEWVSLHSISAYGADSYITEAHTLMDSTGEDDGMTSFRVVAAMEVGALISNSAEGYSIDNIAPEVPTGLMASVSNEGIHLSWDMSAAEDFQYFVLEKSNSADFSDYQMIETVDTSYLDTDYQLESTVYYRLQAFDDGGNVSDYSEAVDMTVLWTDLGIAVPDEYAIHQNYPNPFNPVTTLRYDLPEQAFVNIQIYDMLGRKVRTIVNEQQNPGYKSVLWNAKDDYGTAVSAGLYIYQVQAGSFIQTKKMILVK